MKYAVSMIGPDDVGIYHLTPGAAKIHGSALVHPSGGGEDSIGNWSRPEEWVSWMLEVPRAGSYRVEITYGCGHDSGGSCRISAGDGQLLGTASPTGGWFVRRTESPGTLDLPSGRPLELAVKLVEMRGIAVMDLKKIEMKPVGKPN